MTAEQAAIDVCRSQIRAGNTDAVRLEGWVLDGMVAKRRGAEASLPVVSPRHAIAAAYPPPPAPLPAWKAALLAVLIVGAVALLLFAAGVFR